jgi:hypothetical protein
MITDSEERYPKTSLLNEEDEDELNEKFKRFIVNENQKLRLVMPKRPEIKITASTGW